MRKSPWWALGALLGALGLVVLAAPARSQRPREGEAERPGEQPSFHQRLLRRSRLKGESLDRFLAALGPAVRDHLRAGEQVALPGLGVFRVVRIPEHRDLVDGRPALIPASNYVEFLPTGGLVDAANAPGAVPAVVVPPFQFHPLPNQTPSERAPYVRQPNVRTR